MNPITLESLGWLLTALVLLFVVFLILRQLVLWYFRLNQIANDIAYIAQHYRVMDRREEAERTQLKALEPQSRPSPPSRATHPPSDRSP